MKLHEFITAHRAEILDCFAEQLRKAAPDAPKLDSLDEIATALEEIAASVRDEGSRPGVAEASAARHGRRRHDRGGRIEHVPHDFGTLCDAVFLTAARRGEAFSPSEIQLFNRALDDCISSGVRSFWEQAQKTQERERAKQAGVFAHELRNALSGARFALSALESGHAGACGKTAEVIRRGVLRASALADRGLAITKLRAGVPVASERVRLAELLQDLADAVLPTRGVRVVVEANDELEVVGDHALLGSAVGNLLHNALKFTHDATTVILRASVGDGWALVEVTDQCGGLSVGDPEDLFTPFTQGSCDHTGAGLGLSIARDIAEAHGGELRVRNRPGVGCVFFLRLPAA